MRDNPKVLVNFFSTFFLIFFLLVVQTAASQPLSFLGDVSTMSPLECIGRQCGLAGQACAKNCPASFNELSCKAECSAVMSRCLESRCFFSLHKVQRVQSYCCDNNKFGCVWDDGLGCIDSTSQPCSKNKGFSKFFDDCVNANLTQEQGNNTLNFSSASINQLTGHGSCIDVSECSGSQLCYQGSCVVVAEITPNHRMAVECLDDADCPVSRLARFVCQNSSCIVAPGGFCRSDQECPNNQPCRRLACQVPEVKMRAPLIQQRDPAVGVLQSWALGKQGIMAKVLSTAGSPTVGVSLPEAGKVFSEGDAFSVSSGVAVEVLLADGTRAMVGPESLVVFKKIIAQGSDLKLSLDLGNGEFVLEVSTIHEVNHEVSVHVQELPIGVAIQQGIVSVVMYRDGASKIAVIDGSASVGGVNLSKGMEVIIPPSGVVGKPTKVSAVELKRLEKASKAPIPLQAPPYKSDSFIEKYGVIAVAVILVLILALWLFMKRRPKNQGPQSSSSLAKLDWPELEKKLSNQKLLHV